MRIEGKTIVLRQLRLRDLDDFLSYRSDPEVCKYQGFDVFSKKEAIDFISKFQDKKLDTIGAWIQIGIARKTDEGLIGDCAIKFDAHQPRIAELGCTLNPLFQRKGYGKTALKLLLSTLFRTRNVHKVFGIIDARNEASIRLVKSLGFQQEAHFKQNYFDEKDRMWHDEYQYAVLAAEFRKGIIP